MQLLLIRHGESEDDVIDAYGGWADFHLTDHGKQQITIAAEKISKINIKFDILLSSPLLRARESAEIISKKLNIPIEIFEYVKERNSYGILCGMLKKDAKTKYPWLVSAYENGEYVDGSERIEDIRTRAEKAYELLKNRTEDNVAVLTHGNFLKAFLPIAVNKELVKKDQGGFILLDITPDSAKIIEESGIETK